MSDRIPDLLVEQLMLDELPPEQARRVRQQLEDDGDPRIAELRRSDEEILSAHPPDLVARRIRNRLERVHDHAPPGLVGAEPAARRIGWWWIATTVAVAAAIALAWWIGRSDATTPDTGSVHGEKIAVGPDAPDTTRIKGDPAISIRKQEGSRGTLLSPGDTVKPGDALLVSYRSGDWPHGVIVSLDGAGEVTLHFPADASESTALQHGGSVPLHTFELDDAPGFERFFIVTSSEPIEVERVMESVRALGRGPDPASAELPQPTDGKMVEFGLVRQRR